MKKVISRGLSSFSYAITINIVIGMMIMTCKPGFVPVMPDYAAHFSSDWMAYMVQVILIGVGSAAFGAGSTIMELERWSLIKQSIVFFIVTACVWIPVAVFCWGLGKYVVTFFTVIASYLVSYVITWMVQYKICKNNIKQINIYGIF